MKILKECRRTLQPGGKMVIVDWKKQETRHGPPLGIRYSTKTIGKQLQLAGFQSVKVFNDLPNHFLLIAENN